MKRLIKKIAANLAYKKFNAFGDVYSRISTSDKYYFFYRWLAALAENKAENDHVLCTLARYIDTNRLFNIPFTDIFTIKDSVILVTRRPGNWIGKSGSTIEELTGLINNNSSRNYKIQIIEDNFSAEKVCANWVSFFNQY